MVDSRKQQQLLPKQFMNDFSLARVGLSLRAQMSESHSSNVDNGEKSSLLPLTNVDFSSERYSQLLDIRQNEIQLVGPVQSVHRFHLHTERSSGSSGVLILTNSRLKFVNYREIENDRRRVRSTAEYHGERVRNACIPPFDIHMYCLDSDIEEEDVDLINIYSIRTVKDDQEVLLTVVCNDFRSIEFSMRNNEDIKKLVDQLEQLVGTADTSSSSFFLPSPFTSHKSHQYPYLWSLLSVNYPYDTRSDWELRECDWINGNRLVRLSDVNKSLEMCPTLPPVFPVLGNISDQALSQEFAVFTSEGRVPVVTFSHKLYNYLLIRSCALADERLEYLRNSLSCLEVIRISSFIPTLTKLMSAYTNLRKTCSFYADKSNFLSRVGKWLHIVSRLMVEIKSLVEIFSRSSIVLIEEEDNNFNPLISSVIQVILDKKRRTVRGFESLISKEWIYLCGTGNSLPKPPDIEIFTLFLDIVWQLMIQNEYEFEFTTIYLIRLYDLQTIPWNKETDDGIAKKNEQFSPLIAGIDSNETTDGAIAEENCTIDTKDTLYNLNMDQLMFLYNSYYREGSIDFNCDLLCLQLWRPLYLRWLTISDFEQYYNTFPFLEFIQYQHLLKKLKLKLRQSSGEFNLDNEEISETYL